jgi:hypothetical protein
MGAISGRLILQWYTRSSITYVFKLELVPGDVRIRMRVRGW